ncbi:hypothetical protein HY604_00585 [Candidatus Peregrinibacteria bacterium]|nr:hypothetical protein [Candidatus Peregrinibacteria bacterium]
MHEIDPTKIPAFQRKRSLAAKQRKKTTPKAKIPRIRKPKMILHEDISDILLPSQTIFPSPIEQNSASTRTERRDFEEMKTCGQCEGYFDKINVAIIKLTSPLRIGDIVIFEKESGLFQQTVTSMQINRREVKLATSGSDIGLKVLQKPTVGTRVYKII